MPDPTVKDVLTSDHAELYDTLVARRYFAKFDRITGHLGRVAAEVEAEGRLSRTEARVLGKYLTAVAGTFRALSHKYLMTGRGETAPRLTIDRHESGFPVAQELMTMAVDAQQAEKHLSGMPSEAELKDRMVRQIVGDQTIPTALQFALSQRYYYEALVAGGIFWARNDPDAQWIEDLGERRHFLVHWAVWDSQANLPVVYLLNLEDEGKRPILNDAYRWPTCIRNGCGGSSSGRCIRRVSPCSRGRSPRCWKVLRRRRARTGLWSGRWRICCPTARKR
jgi:hypothetical protein